MTASTAAELGDFVPAVGISFEIFGRATQGDLDILKQDLKLSGQQRMILQDIWARHPIQAGEKRRYLYVSYSSRHFLITIFYI
jgi:hypothetical protein